MLKDDFMKNLFGKVRKENNVHEYWLKKQFPDIMAFMSAVNVLMVGDVCATIGVLAVQKCLPALIQEYAVDFTVLNAENALEGEGLDEALAKVFFNAGADVISGGNHSLQNFALRKNFLQIEQVLRPANIPDVGGSGITLLQKADAKFCVVNLLGRENMRLADSPFAFADRFFPDAPDCFRIVDFHAEAAEEKEAFGLYLDGRVSIVAGTHTHVQTTDEKILPNGTAYISDIGFVGAEYSVIGSRPAFALERQQKFFSAEKRWAERGDAVFSAILVCLDSETKKAQRITRILKKLKV